MLGEYVQCMSHHKLTGTNKSGDFLLFFNWAQGCFSSKEGASLSVLLEAVVSVEILSSSAPLEREERERA